MPCDIVVCIKQVPHPDYLSKISLDPIRGTMERERAPAIINLVGRNALEEALRIRERFSGSVTVITMGPPQARKALEEALAMDVDAAIHLCDEAFARADTLATAQALAYAISKLEHSDLILCGDATIDSGTGQVPIQLAEFLKLPCIFDADELVFEDERGLLIKRRWEQGYIKVRTKLPAVIAVTAKINQPRLPNVSGIMAAIRKEIKKWGADDIGADLSRVGLEGSPTRFFQISEFHAERQGEVFQGSPEEVINMAIDRLVKLEVL